MNCQQVYQEWLLHGGWLIVVALVICFGLPTSIWIWDRIDPRDFSKQLP